MAIFEKLIISSLMFLVNMEISYDQFFGNFEFRDVFMGIIQGQFSVRNELTDLSL